MIRNFTNGDLSIEFVNGSAEVAEQISHNLRLIKGEDIFDSERGLYLQRTIRDTQSVMEVEGEIKLLILATPKVIGISKFVTELMGRNLITYIGVDTEYGPLQLEHII